MTTQCPYCGYPDYDPLVVKCPMCGYILKPPMPRDEQDKD